MLPDRVLNPGPLTYESGVLPIALRGPAIGAVLSWLALSTELQLLLVKMYNYFLYIYKDWLQSCQILSEKYNVML